MPSLLCVGVVSLLSGLALVGCLPMDDGRTDDSDYFDLPETTDVRMAKTVDSKAAGNKLSTLRYISVITRHGHRSPTASFPNDPYPYTDVRYWPDGPGQLTKVGKRQLFRTGRILRRRYDGFLSANYLYNETSVRSNPYDRDFSSAACLLAGLFPPVGYQLWHRRIIWQPIPIWVDNYDVALIVSNPDLCPRFIEEMHKAFSAIDSEFPMHRELLEYLSINMGQEMDKISRIPSIWDTLELQMENGFKLPPWAMRVYPDKLKELEGRAFRAYVGDSREQIRLISGPILRMILDQVNEKAQGVMIPNRKIHILAAHDVTLRAVLSGIGINDPFPIASSAFMVFELHETSQGHTIQVLYYNSSSNPKPNILELPPCRTPCTLANFNKALEPLIPGNWTEECFNVTTPQTRSRSGR